MSEQPTIQATFAKSLKTCSVMIDGHFYADLIVKKINIADWKEPEFVYIVKIPCAKALGDNYMVAFGLDAIYGYKHPERQPFVYTPYNDEDDVIVPIQLGLFGDEK